MKLPGISVLFAVPIKAMCVAPIVIVLLVVLGVLDADMVVVRIHHNMTSASSTVVEAFSFDNVLSNLQCNESPCAFQKSHYDN